MGVITKEAVLDLIDRMRTPDPEAKGFYEGTAQWSARQEAWSLTDMSLLPVLEDIISEHTGDVMSKLLLAQCYKRGMGGDKDYAEAMKLYRQIASRRNLYGKYNHEVSVAQYEIGNMYMKGLGVETDFRQAYDWIRLAAENGNIAAERR